MNFIYFFGEGKELTALQMGCRALVVYFITLILLKVSGIRTFGKKTAFDNIIIIMLGAVLSRAIAGASPFFATMCAGFVMALSHRVLGWLSLYFQPLGKFVKGKESILYQNGEIIHKNLKRNLLTDGDLMESVRLSANINSLEQVETVYMERNGQISVVMKPSK
ncbi:MAG: hypothetical protein JWQ25_2418 [Daejeonella sp.]|nr:hypothetical protein [Daejeonella sp.]